MSNKNNAHNFDKISRKENFSLARLTTYGLGGVCNCAYFPKDEYEAHIIFDELQASKENFYVLGRGSDILAADGKLNLSVICTSSLLGLERVGNCTIKVSSGTTVANLLKYCKKEGLSGIEYLAGIPASLGGIACMNAGAAGIYISENILSVDIYDGKKRVLANKYCNFGDKHSIMRDITCIIDSVTLSLFKSTPDKVESNISKYLKARRNQPKGKSCGCVFKNPKGISAGKIIDECGLKGFYFGGAQVSHEHANFIINNGAKSRDVYELIQLVKSEVFKKTGLFLEEEVVYIGEFNETDS